MYVPGNWLVRMMRTKKLKGIDEKITREKHLEYNVRKTETRVIYILIDSIPDFLSIHRDITQIASNTSSV